MLLVRISLDTFEYFLYKRPLHNLWSLRNSIGSLSSEPLFKVAERPCQRMVALKVAKLKKNSLLLTTYVSCDFIFASYRPMIFSVTCVNRFCRIRKLV